MSGLKLKIKGAKPYIELGGISIIEIYWYFFRQGMKRDAIININIVNLRWKYSAFAPNQPFWAAPAACYFLTLLISLRPSLPPAHSVARLCKMSRQIWQHWLQGAGARVARLTHTFRPIWKCFSQTMPGPALLLTPLFKIRLSVKDGVRQTHITLKCLLPWPTLVLHDMVKKSYCDYCGQYCDCDIINKWCHESTCLVIKENAHRLLIILLSVLSVIYIDFL